LLTLLLGVLPLLAGQHLQCCTAPTNVDILVSICLFGLLCAASSPASTSYCCAALLFQCLRAAVAVVPMSAVCCLQRQHLAHGHRAVGRRPAGGWKQRMGRCGRHRLLQQRARQQPPTGMCWGSWSSAEQHC
jgi:hypothetical protein